LPSLPRPEALRGCPEPVADPPAPKAEAVDEQSERAAIVSQLAGGILHDFNNVLTVITGTIEILAEAVADRPQLAAVAQLIDEAATRGARLAMHLLALVREQPSSRDEININVLLAEAVSLLRPTLGGRIEIAFDPAVPVVMADPGQLLAAILSLGIAFRDAMLEQEILTLRAGLAGAAAAGAVAIRAQAAGLAGASEHPPARTIDLRFVESLVVRSGGELAVSRSGVGTSVEIVLPRAAIRAHLSADG
jgi:C4-dicarboxylate-specific signal transduction histidine kinase